MLEGLRCSAWQRLPRDKSTADTDQAIVAAVAELVELCPILNKMICMPGAGGSGTGLLVEQRKCVTIRVETPANPSSVRPQSPLRVPPCCVCLCFRWRCVGGGGGGEGGVRRRLAAGGAGQVLCLDEPTSGLDSRSARVVMPSVRRISASARTLLCTIHQPSSQILSIFDPAAAAPAGTRGA